MSEKKNRLCPTSASVNNRNLEIDKFQYYYSAGSALINIAYHHILLSFNYSPGFSTCIVALAAKQARLAPDHTVHLGGYCHECHCLVDVTAEWENKENH